MSHVRPIARSDLRNILKGGATTRILDLHSIARKHGEQEGHAEAPFFLNSRLNRAFIVKHTVRAHERPYVMSCQPVVTKVIVPLAESDLSLGGHAVFVEEIGFTEKMRTLFERVDEPHMLELDLGRLRELASLPSFDPFLLAERYRDHARPVAELYFDISASEMERMENEVARQIVLVVSRAFGHSTTDDDQDRARRFAHELLSHGENDRLTELRRSLDMTAPEFKAGMFGWKGILYYRWSMSEAFAGLKDFLQRIRSVSIVGATNDERTELEHMRQRIIKETRNRWLSLNSVMSEYDTAYRRFCTGEDTNGFKRFLLRAPGCFLALGSDLSIVSHIPGYWNFWDQQNSRGYLQAREAMSLFADFLASITRQESTWTLDPAAAEPEGGYVTFSRPPDIIVSSAA
jgi:hypothetical protein